MQTTLQPITAYSALKRKDSAPQLVVVAPSGSGKSTLIYMLLSQKLIPYMRVGIGEKSQTTIIPCEFCFDERIDDESSFAIQIVKKEFTAKEIDETVIKNLMDLFFRNDCDIDDTLDAFDETVFNRIIEPEAANYHLGQIREKISANELKQSLRPILDYMIENDFQAKAKTRKESFKGKKVKLQDIREMVFMEMIEEMPDDVSNRYRTWMKQVKQIVDENLREAITNQLYNQDMMQCHLEMNDYATTILTSLFDPNAPHSLLVDHIMIACKPREELIKTAHENYPGFPLRFSVRDTMGLTQTGIDAKSTNEGFEAALNYNADSIIFLLSLEERDDTLSECCKALITKSEDLHTKRKLDTSLYVLFTKADRKVENYLNKCVDGNLFITQETYTKNIKDALISLENSVDTYASALQKEDVDWVSMRYVENSYIFSSLNQLNDPRKNHFVPQGLFSKIVDYVMGTLTRSLPAGVTKPLFVSVSDPDQPAVQVHVNAGKIQLDIQDIQHRLCKEKEIINGYIIDPKTPQIHGRSVVTYWHNLAIGLGHITHASVYGNFAINMKGLIKRMLRDIFPSFATLDKNNVITFTADNLTDEVLLDVFKSLLETDDLTTGFNPALGERNIALQRLYDFYLQFFMNEYRYSSLLDRVAYNLSYGNKEVKQMLTAVYEYTPGYDKTMRNLQESFKTFFESPTFERILVEELAKNMTDMVNKSFITI